MLSHRISFFIGLFLLLLPITGIPTWWKFFFVILTGLALVIISGLSLKRETISRFIHRRERTSEMYVENKEKRDIENPPQSFM